MSEGTDTDHKPELSIQRPTSRLSRINLRRLVAVVCIAAVLASVLLASPLLSAHRVVEVGVIIPLTGPRSYLVDVRDGMVLAAEKLNRWGGMDGAEIRLLVRDSESDPTKAVEAFEELEKNEKPLFYVSAESAQTMALVPLAEEYEVPLIAVVASAQNLVDGVDWTSRYYSDAYDEVVATMHTLETLNVSDLGIIYESDAYGVSVKELLVESLSTAGMSYESVMMSSDETDYADEIAQVSDRESIFIVATANYMMDVILDVRESGYAGHVLASSSSSSAMVMSMPEAEGIYVTAPAMYNPLYLPVKPLTQEFEDRFGRPLTHYVACGYDVIHLVSGLVRGLELTRTNLHVALDGGFVFSGAIGPLNVSPGSHDIGFDLFSARIWEGRLWYL